VENIVSNEIYIPVEIALFFGIEFDFAEPGPDNTTVVSVPRYKYREALIEAAYNLA
jgi:hypothetical protein